MKMTTKHHNQSNVELRRSVTIDTSAKYSHAEAPKNIEHIRAEDEGVC